MQVRREQCSGSKYFDYFTCPLCQKFVVDMEIHDGGYNQPFCQKPFCATCLIKLFRVKDKNFTGPVVKKYYRCPVLGCTPALQPPMIRGPDASELKLYREMVITCDSCLVGMDPYRYQEHKSECPGKPVGEIVLRDVSGPLLQVPNAEVDQLFRKNLLMAGNSSPNLTGKVTYARAFAEPRSLVFGVHFANRETRVQVKSDVNHNWMLAQMKKAYEFAVNLDLVHIEVKEMGENANIDDFLAEIDVGAPLNVCRASNWEDERGRIKFCYIQGVRKESCSTGTRIFNAEVVEE